MFMKQQEDARACLVALPILHLRVVVRKKSQRWAALTTWVVLHGSHQHLSECHWQENSNPISLKEKLGFFGSLK